MQRAILSAYLHVRLNTGARGVSVLEYNIVFNTCNWYDHTLYRIEKGDI
tara:strand:- start:636 stop:782 length:147 start_codon:yes stop_codon:yes gene_type:complete